MNRPSLQKLVLVAIMLVAASASSATEWRLNYTVDTQHVQKGPHGTAPSRADAGPANLTVILGLQYLVVDDGRTRSVFDFARRRVLEINLDRHEYDDWSLYAYVGGRVSELQNRFAIGAGLRAAKAAGWVDFDRYGSETNLGLELPGMSGGEPEPAIVREDGPGGARDFAHDGQSVVQFVPAAVRVPDSFLPRFGSFLAYECHLHPEIRRQIVASGRIPQLLVIHWKEVNGPSTATYHLQSAQAVGTDSTALPPGCRPARHSDDSFTSLFSAVSLARDDGRGAHRITREEAERFAHDAIAAKRPLDAFLALLEYTLQSGEEISGDFRKYQKEFSADARCRLYAASLDQSSRAACLKSLANCESIDRSHLQKAYLLDLQRADLLQLLGRGAGNLTSSNEAEQIRTAEALFLKVLAANPFLTGAYHDLGRLYFETYQPAVAWVCFDTGRRVAPDHPIFREIMALEHRYEHDFPDFF